jgi:hypothetical protein
MENGYEDVRRFDRLDERSRWRVLELLRIKIAKMPRKTNDKIIFIIFVFR